MWSSITAFNGNQLQCQVQCCIRKRHIGIQKSSKSQFYQRFYLSSLLPIMLHTVIIYHYISKRLQCQVQMKRLTTVVPCILMEIVYPSPTCKCRTRFSVECCSVSWALSWACHHRTRYFIGPTYLGPTILKKGIGSLLDHCVTRWLRSPFWWSHLEILHRFQPVSQHTFTAITWKYIWNKCTQKRQCTWKKFFCQA